MTDEEFYATLRATSNVIALGYMTTWKLTEDQAPKVALANARIVADSGWLDPEFLDFEDPALNTYLAAIGPDQARNFISTVRQPHFGDIAGMKALVALAEAVDETDRDWTGEGPAITIRPGTIYPSGSAAVTELLVRMSPAKVITLVEELKGSRA